MGRPRSFDEPQVIRRARETFHDHGYTATSVEDLTAATGLNRSSLYCAFGDKHGLFLRSFALYCDEDAKLVEDELTGDERGALARLKGHFRQKSEDPSASARGCLLAKATAELASEDPEVLAMAKDFYVIYERALSTCVRQAQAVGNLRTDLDPDATGAMLLAVLRGIEALGRAGHTRSALDTMADTTFAALAPAAR